jgi:hypothetical protein
MFTNEDDIDSALKAALDVRPSAGFEAGVQGRIEADRPAEGHGALPYWLAAAAALVLIAGAWFALRDPTVVVPAPQLAERTPPVETAPGVVGPAPPAPAYVAPERAPRTAPAATARVARRSDPEVIVPPNQMELIERLMRDVQAGRVELPEQTAAVTAPPAELIVAPVSIDQIPVQKLEMTTPAPPTSKGLY